MDQDASLQCRGRTAYWEGVQAAPSVHQEPPLFRWYSESGRVPEVFWNSLTGKGNPADTKLHHPAPTVSWVRRLVRRIKGESKVRNYGEIADIIREETKFLTDRVALLEQKVKDLAYDAGDDFTTIEDLREMSYGLKPKRIRRVSAMQGVSLIMKHLGLKFNRIEATPARVELAPIEDTK
jgi:hypothetical protein